MATIKEHSQEKEQTNYDRSAHFTNQRKAKQPVPPLSLTPRSPKKGYITKTRLYSYIENIISKNWKKNKDKNSDIFHILLKTYTCIVSIR